MRGNRRYGTFLSRLLDLFSAQSRRLPASHDGDELSGEEEAHAYFIDRDKEPGRALPFIRDPTPFQMLRWTCGEATAFPSAPFPFPPVAGGGRAG